MAIVAWHLMLIQLQVTPKQKSIRLRLPNEGTGNAAFGLPVNPAQGWSGVFLL
jgi:hypothetical protein